MIMKTIRYRTVAAMLAVLMCTVCLCFTSCYQAPPTIIDPVDDTATSTTADINSNSPDVTETEETYVTRPTVAVPAEQLTIPVLIKLHDVSMPWSAIEGYAHDMTGDNTAHFAVADGYGEECSLDVVIDLESGLLTEATLTYGDVSETILTHRIQGINRIMLLMSEAE